MNPTIIDNLESIFGEIPNGYGFIYYVGGFLVLFFVLHIIEHIFETLFGRFYK